MPTLSLCVESRENLRKPETESLTIPEPELTVRRLITLRVLHRTATLTEEEQRKAVDQALDAFGRDLYLVVVDRRRVEGLEERLNLREDTQVLLEPRATRRGVAGEPVASGC